MKLKIKCLPIFAKKAEQSFDGLKVHVYKIRNDFFGESITVAGLLTGVDIVSQLKDKELGEKLLLPRVMLRAEGDLTLDGMTPQEIQDALNTEIEFTDGDGGAFFDALVY